MRHRPPTFFRSLRRSRSAAEAARRESFADQVRSTVQERALAGIYVYDAEDFALVERESGSRYSLDGDYARFRSARNERARDEVVAAAARRAYIPPFASSFSAAVDKLCVRLERRAVHQLAHLGARRGLQPVVEGVTQETVRVLCYVGPARATVVHREQLDRWGCGVNAAFDAALDNMRAALSLRIEEAPHGMILVRGAHAGALCLQDRLCGDVLKGPHVALAPRSDLVIFAGGEDPVGLEAMLDLSRRLPRETHGWTVPVLRSQSGWQRFETSDSRLLRALRALEVPQLLADFANQKMVLDAVHARRGLDIDVPSVFETTDDTGVARTTCSWSGEEGVLMPVTDFVEISRCDRGAPLRVPWRNLEVELRGNLRGTDLHPPRVRVCARATVDLVRALQRGGSEAIAPACLSDTSRPPLVEGGPTERDEYACGSVSSATESSRCPVPTTASAPAWASPS